MLRKASAKRKSDAASQQSGLTGKRPASAATPVSLAIVGNTPAAPLQQKTLDFGKPSSGLRNHPVNQAAHPTTERNIAWHFCDPKGRRLDQRLAASTPIARPAGATAPPPSGSEKSQRQVSALLSLMSRGKQRQQRTAPAVTPKLPEQDEESPLLGLLHQPAANRDGVSDLRGGEDDGTNELLDSLVQIAEESSQSQVTGGDSSDPAPAVPPVPAASDPVAAAAAPAAPAAAAAAAAPAAAAAVAPAATEEGADDSEDEIIPTQKSTATLGAPPGPVKVAARPADAVSQRAPAAAEASQLALCSVSSDGCRNIERQPQRVTSGVVLQMSGGARDEDVVLRLRLDIVDESAAPRAADGSDAPPPELHVHLRDEWRQTPVRAGDRVHLIGEIEAAPSTGASQPLTAVPPAQAQVVLTRGSGPVLVLRPETIVTGTALAAACNCPRRAALGRQRKDDGRGAYQMTLGTMKHSVVEALLHA